MMPLSAAAVKVASYEPDSDRHRQRKRLRARVRSLAAVLARPRTCGTSVLPSGTFFHGCIGAFDAQRAQYSTKWPAQSAGDSRTSARAQRGYAVMLPVSSARQSLRTKKKARVPGNDDVTECARSGTNLLRQAPTLGSRRRRNTLFRKPQPPCATTLRAFCLQARPPHHCHA